MNADGFISPSDALTVINDLNNIGSRKLVVPPLAPNVPRKFIDVTGDNFVAPLDALQIINDLNTNGARATGNSGISGGEGEEPGVPVDEASNLAFLITDMLSPAANQEANLLASQTTIRHESAAALIEQDPRRNNKDELIPFINWNDDDASDDLLDLLASELIMRPFSETNRSMN